MFAKLNCLKSQSTLNGTKETEFRKYVRERNEKILEKCFNIKPPTIIVVHNETSEQQQYSNVKQLPQQPISSTQTEQSEIREHLQKTTKLLETDSAANMAEEILNTNKSNNIKNIELPKPKKTYKRNQIKESPQSDHASLKSTRLVKSAHSSSMKKPISTIWKSPFNSFITTSASKHSHANLQYSQFAYDLSREEQKFAGQFCSPMKPLPEAEHQLLRMGQRRAYLMKRYEHSPTVKYNYPEATSWRIGWLHQQQQ